MKKNNPQARRFWVESVTFDEKDNSVEWILSRNVVDFLTKETKRQKYRYVEYIKSVDEIKEQFKNTPYENKPDFEDQILACHEHLKNRAKSYKAGVITMLGPGIMWQVHEI